MPRKILRRRTELAPYRGELTCDNGQWQFARHAHDNVISFFSEIYAAVGYGHVDVQIGVSTEEVRKGWRNMQRPEGDRRGDAKGTARLRMQTARHLLGLHHLLDDAVAVLDKDSSDLGDAQMTSAAVEQTHAERMFELRHRLAHRRT